MKKTALILISILVIFSLGCAKKSDVAKIDREVRELNLNFLNIAAERGLFDEFAPDTIMPNDFYKDKYDKKKYKVISLDGEAIERMIKDNKEELLFKDDVTYIVMNYTGSIRKLYDNMRGIETTTTSSSDLTMYRVYKNKELKTVELNGEDARNAHLAIIVLNQLYHTENQAEFNEWYLSIRK